MSSIHMDAWMDAWMEGECMDGCMDGCMDIWTRECMMQKLTKSTYSPGDKPKLLAWV